MKKRASKVAHNRPKPFYFTVQPRHSPQPRIDFSYYEISRPDICFLLKNFAELGCFCFLLSASLCRKNLSVQCLNGDSLHIFIFFFRHLGPSLNTWTLLTTKFHICQWNFVNPWPIWRHLTCQEINLSNLMLVPCTMCQSLKSNTHHIWKALNLLKTI